MLFQSSAVLLLLLTPLSQDFNWHGPILHSLDIIGGLTSMHSLPPHSLVFVSADLDSGRKVRNKRKPKRPNVEVLHNKAGIGKFNNMVLCKKAWEGMHDRWMIICTWHTPLSFHIS